MQQVELHLHVVNSYLGKYEPTGTQKKYVNVNRHCTRQRSSLPVAPSSWRPHVTTAPPGVRAWCIDWRVACSSTSWRWTRGLPEESGHSTWRVMSTFSSYVHSTLQQTWRAQPSRSTRLRLPYTNGFDIVSQNSSTASKILPSGIYVAHVTVDRYNCISSTKTMDCLHLFMYNMDCCYEHWYLRWWNPTMCNVT